MKGNLTALSESRWKYETKGKTEYIRHWRERECWVLTDQNGKQTTLDGVESIEQATDAADGVFRAAGRKYHLLHCATCRGQTAHTADPLNRTAACAGCGASQGARLHRCGTLVPAGSVCPTCAGTP